MIQLTRKQADNCSGELLKQPQDIEYIEDMLLVPYKETEGGITIYFEFYGGSDAYFILEPEVG